MVLTFAVNVVNEAVVALSDLNSVYYIEDNNVSVPSREDSDNEDNEKDIETLRRLRSISVT